MWWPESSLQGEGQGHRPSVAAVLAFETDPAPITLCVPPLTPPLEHSLGPFFCCSVSSLGTQPSLLCGAAPVPCLLLYCPCIQILGPRRALGTSDFSSCLEWAVAYGIGPAFLPHTQGGIAHNPSAPDHSSELPQLCINPWGAGRPLFLILLS